MIQPMRDIVLVKADNPKTQLESGIVLAENWKTLPLHGEVLATGPEVKTVKPGDRISFMRYATVILEDDERFCNERHIYGILNE